MGVVSITVYPEYLGAALASLSLNPGDIAALIQNDGTFLARSQKIDEALGHKVPPDRPFLNGSQSDANTFRALSQFTQKPLVYSWRRLADWGLIATVGLDESAELSPVREAIAASGLRNWIAVTVAMGFSLAIAGLLLWAQRQKRELATSDERFALAVRGSNDGIWDCDLRQNTMFFSAQWKRQLGYEDDELENAFSTFESLMHSEDWPSVKEKIDRYVAGDGEPYRVQFRMRHKNGSYRWILSRGDSVRDKNGIPYRVAGSHTDITELREVQDEISRQREELLRSNADLEQFAYVASHDLQTPLRNIISYSQLLEHRYKGRFDTDADDFIGFIVDSGRRMSLLISDLLEYSRITSQSKPLHAVQAREAAALALKNLGPDISAAGAEIVVGDLPCVMAEHSQLVSLFQNLIGNAIKYRAADRTLRLSVSAERVERRQWRFDIADNGIGIDPAYHEKIFEIFQRLDAASETQGTGIGLTLCRRIVHRFGGTIWLKSDPGEGTTFSCLFDARSGNGAFSA